MYIYRWIGIDIGRLKESWEAKEARRSADVALPGARPSTAPHGVGSEFEGLGSLGLLKLGTRQCRTVLTDLSKRGVVDWECRIRGSVTNLSSLRFFWIPKPYAGDSRDLLQPGVNRA